MDEDEIGGIASKDGEKAPHQTQCTNSEPVPRATRRTRNAVRDWDIHGSQHVSLSPKEDRIANMASMILSRLDTESYEYAAWDDADRIMTNYILPKSLPWHKPRVPLLRSLPRDIEDMQGVWHAGDDGRGAALGNHINSGPFGYGMFDMGGLLKEDVKGTRADTIIAAKPSTSMVNSAPLSPNKRHSIDSKECGIIDDDEHETPFECSDRVESAARRSDDPGIIELTVRLPLPSITTCLLNMQRHKMLSRDPSVQHDQDSIKVAKSILQGERAEMCSSMPLYWSKTDKGSFKEPPAYSDLTVCGDTDNEGNSIYKMMQKRQGRKRKLASLTEACTRKWKVSVKVSSVTSRSTLSNPELRPMYCAAILPSYVQCGQTVTIDSARIRDKEEGLREYLGSYDCRATAINSAMSFEAMDKKDVKVGKETGPGRAKRINVGRSRLIWSKAKMSSSKASFSSLLTGQKLDASAQKRPKDIKVTIKLNGKVLSDIVENEADQKRNSGNSFSEKTSWSKAKINNAIAAVCGEIVSNSEDIKVEELPAKAQCTFDPEDYLELLVKDIKDQGKEGAPQHFSDIQELSKEIVFSDGSTIPQYIRPKLCSLPLDEGFLRSFCNKPGTLKGSSILPKLLSSIASSETKHGDVCTVCWTGSDTHQVLKCLQCGLLSHRECCLDPGDYVINSENNLVWRCAVCKAAPPKDILPKVSKTDTDNQTNCIIALQTISPSNVSRKSRRTSRIPTRFKEEHDEEEKKCTSPIVPDKDPGPKCTLCPHSGGAMSRAIDGRSVCNERWTHEVCRIWCTKQKKKEEETKCSSQNKMPQASISQRALLEEVCCICGMGRIHNMGEETEEVLLQSQNAGKVPGLIKCAASGCNVNFHPMCALMTSKLSQIHIDSVRDNSSKRLDDQLLCQQFSLDFVDLDRLEHPNGISEERSYVIPVGFCGLHNQERQKDLYGCMPSNDIETKLLFNLMKIPHNDG